MVVGLAWTHAPATGGDSVGVVAPRATGVEKVTLMLVLVGAILVPEVGVVERMASGIGVVVAVVEEVPPPPPAFLAPDEDFPRS